MNTIHNVYDTTLYASVYDALYGALLHDGRQALVCAMQPMPGDRILEMGVGSGLTLPLYPQHVRVLGLDIAAKMLGRAQARVHRLNLKHVELKLSDAEQTDLMAASFDHVVLPYVYSVTTNPERLVDESFRLCRPGGTVWILNHFSGLGGWDWLGWVLKPFAQRVGFRSDFPYAKYVTQQAWNIASVRKVNLLGLSRLIEIRNVPAASGPRLSRD